MPAALYETKFGFFVIPECGEPESVKTLGKVKALIEGSNDKDDDDILKDIESVKSKLTKYQHEACWIAMAGSDYFGNERPYDVEWLAGMCLEVCDDPYICIGVIKGHIDAVEFLTKLETLASGDYFSENQSMASVVQLVRDFLAHSLSECAIVFVAGLD